MLLRYLGLGDVVILGILAGDNAVGIYSMGLKVFLLISSIMKVTATTLMPRSAYYIENKNTEGFKHLFNNTIRMLFMVGLPISVCMYLFAEPVIILLGGKQFVGAIDLMKEMSFFLLLSVLINTYVFQALYPQNKTKSIIWAHAIGLAVSVVLNFVLVPYLSFQGTFVAFAISYIAIAVVLVAMEKEYFKSSFSIRENINYLCASIVAILPTILIDIFCKKVSGCGHLCFWFIVYSIYLR